MNGIYKNEHRNTCKHFFNSTMEAVYVLGDFEIIT